MLTGTTRSVLVLDFRKYDKLGAEIKPGDVCAYSRNNMIEFVIYIGSTKGNSSTGQFGKFYTANGKVSLKHSSVIFVFDPNGSRRNNSKAVNLLVRKFYEGLV